MSTTQSIIDFLLDQLADCGAVTARKMFGEYCLYYDGRPVGLVCDNQLFLEEHSTGARVAPEGRSGALSACRPLCC